MSKSNVKFFNNDEGVSPIVATLVLIVVAIVGAAAVGLIMGSFSSNVSKQANTGNTQAQASDTIVMGGSTTVQPLAQILATAYMNNNTGVKITVQAGGSGAGELGVATGALDMGMASEDIKTKASYIAKYPNVQEYTIGGSGIVEIVGSAVNVPTTAGIITGYNPADVKADYLAGAVVSTDNLGSTGIKTLYTRSDASGTADAFAKYLGTANKAGSDLQVSGVTGVASNALMLSTIQSDANGFGYVDYGFASTATLGKTAGNIQIVPLYNSATKTYQPADTTQALILADTHTMIKAALKESFGGATTSNNYPITAVRPLNLLTNGNPTAIEQSIISFFQQPSSQYAFTQLGYDSMYDIGV